LGDSRSDQARYDEGGAARRLGHEHDRRQRHAVAGPEEGGDADDREERARGRPEEAADSTPDERALDDERNEQTTGAATGHGRGRGRSAQEEHADDERQPMVWISG